MNPFGDGSDLALNVTSGTTNLILDHKYQFTNVTVASGASISTGSSTGSVLYITAQGTITINGTIDVSNKVSAGSNGWSTVIDGVTYSTPGVAAGGSGYTLSGNSVGLGFHGFGGGGSGGYSTISGDMGGNGGTATGLDPNGGNVATISRTTSGTSVLKHDGTDGGGGSGVGVSYLSLSSGSATITANGGAGGETFGANGSNGTGSSSGSFSGSYAWSAGGGGGAGGNAGKAGVHVILKAPTIVINGTIITSGAAGSKGGNGGRTVDHTGATINYGGGGGGGGGGHAGSIGVYYTSSLTDTATKTMLGASGGAGGTGDFNQASTASSGSSGSNGIYIVQQLDSVTFDSTSDMTVAGNKGLYGSVVFDSTSDLIASGNAKFYGSALFDSTSDLLVNGIHSKAIKQIERKSFMYKVYSPSGTFIRAWDDVISEFSYSQDINTPGSAISVELARNSDKKFRKFSSLTTQDGVTPILTPSGQPITVVSRTDNNIGPGTDVDLNLRVDVYVYYGSLSVLTTPDGTVITTETGDPIYVTIGAPNGRRVFSGYISEINSRYGSSETVKVQVLGFGDELDNWVLESAGKTKVAYNTTDPSTIVTDSLTKFNAAGGILTYDSTSVDATGSVVSYTFNTNTQLEVLQKVIELTPRDWYWYVDQGTNKVHLHQKAAAAKHTFVLGKHIKDLDLVQYITDITNLVYFTGGEITPGVNLFAKYTDATSQSTYRRGLQRFNDSRVTLKATADIISQAAIDRYKGPQYKTSLTILSDVYEIEEINLGDMIQFRNFGNYVDTVLMQVVSKDYSPDAVALQLDTVPPNINKRIQDLKRNLDVLNVISNPDTPS